VAALAPWAPSAADWLAARIEGRTLLQQTMADSLMSLVGSYLAVGEPLIGGEPTIRATAFAPSKRSKESVPRMYPICRVTSANPSRWLSPGDEGFARSPEFSCGEVFVGKCWESAREIYSGEIHAQSDYPGSDQDRHASWEAQWRTWGANSTLHWSSHMRHVRSVWAFPVPSAVPRASDPDSYEPFAIVSVDSTRPRDFESPEPLDGSALRMNLREAVAGAIAGAVHVGLGRVKPAVFPLS